MAPDNSSPPSAGVDAQIAKYAEWAARLEGNIEDMARQRRASWLYLASGGVLCAIVWRFHHFVAGSLLTLGIILWITALYITWMRTWYYRNELRRAKVEIDALLEQQVPDAPSEPT
jgi:hypothetical protein